MALGRFKHQGGIKNGEWYAAAGQTYIGGQPAAINSSGELVLATSGIAASYVGIFANTYSDDGVTATQKAKATFYAGLTILTLEAEADGTYPYDDSLTWDEGDKVYIGADGKWTNVQPGSTSAKGIVLEVGTNYLVVMFFPPSGA